MDAIDRMIEHDLWLTRQLLDAAGGLPADKVSEPLEVTPVVPHDFPQERPTVVDMLERLIVLVGTPPLRDDRRAEAPRRRRGIGRPDRMGAARTLNAACRP
jgi:hypothetical protein